MTTPVRRILIVDDHDAVRRGVRQLLECNPNYRVVGEARNGRSALGLARTIRPNIAIVDVALPELNGLDLSRELMREVPRIEVLIYTIHDEKDLVTNVFRAGVRGFVLKSEPERHLIAALDALAIHRSYFSPTITDTLLDQFLVSTGKPGVDPLSPRERQVVQLIAEGYLNREVADRLGICIKTVETHRATTMSKLDLDTTADLVRYAIRNNLAAP